MSAIGEASGFGKTAARLRKQLQEHGFAMSPEERAALIKDIAWYEDEADFCRRAALQEAREDMASDAMERRTVPFDDETTESEPEESDDE